jgi:hypothetical protein
MQGCQTQFATIRCSSASSPGSWTRPCRRPPGRRASGSTASGCAARSHRRLAARRRRAAGAAVAAAPHQRPPDARARPIRPPRRTRAAPAERTVIRAVTAPPDERIIIFELDAGDAAAGMPAASSSSWSPTSGTSWQSGADDRISAVLRERADAGARAEAPACRTCCRRPPAGPGATVAAVARGGVRCSRRCRPASGWPRSPRLAAYWPAR